MTDPSKGGNNMIDHDINMADIIAKGLIGKAQRGAHEGLDSTKPIFTTGSLNFPAELLQRVDEETAEELECILFETRMAIIKLLGG